jgi:thiamine biosynthesis lipoprotein
MADHPRAQQGTEGHELLTGRFTHRVMGTVVSFDLHDPVPADALAAARRWLDHIDAVFSTYRADSDISRLDRSEIRLADCDPHVATVLELCAQATAATDGYFSATADRHLDPSGLVKGWAIERASDRLREAGSRHHVVNGGGDIQTVGTTVAGSPWRVGITDPFHRDRILATLEVSDLAVATSGVAERGHHVINPRTGRPACHLASVTVICPRLTSADVLATAAMARGLDALEWLNGLPGTAALVVTASGDVASTPNWPGVDGPLMMARDITALSI